MQTELSACKSEVSISLRELSDLTEKHQESWRRKREEIQLCLDEIKQVMEDLNGLEQQYEEQVGIAAKHISDQCNAKLIEVREIVEVI